MNSVATRRVVLRCAWLVPVCAGALTAPLTAFAVTKPKPGLWQQYTQSEVNGKDVVAAMAAARQQMMANASTMQRAIIEKRFGSMNDDPHIVKTCLSAEQAAKINDPKDFVDQLNKDHAGCQYGTPSVDGDTIKFHGSCTGSGNYNGDMDGTLLVKSDSAYTMTFAGKGTVDAGGSPTPLEVKGKIDAKWLSDDCGGIAPDE